MKTSLEVLGNATLGPITAPANQAAEMLIESPENALSQGLANNFSTWIYFYPTLFYLSTQGKNIAGVLQTDVITFVFVLASLASSSTCRSGLKLWRSGPEKVLFLLPLALFLPRIIQNLRLGLRFRKVIHANEMLINKMLMYADMRISYKCEFCECARMESESMRMSE